MGYFEFHCHSRYSPDAGASLDQIVARAKIHEVTGIALTDHDTIDGALLLKKSAPDWLTVVIGEEINTTAGEIIGLFLKEWIAPGQTPEATIAAIKRQGGLVIAPHPCDRLRKKRITATALEKHIHDFDAIENFNARNVFSADNSKAEALIERFGKTAIAASDAHFQGEYGHTIMRNVDPSSPQAFLQSLKYENFQMRKAPLLYHGLTKYMKMLNRLKY